MLWLRGSELYRRGYRPQGDPVHFLKDFPGQEQTSPDAFVLEMARSVVEACCLCIVLNQRPDDPAYRRPRDDVPDLRSHANRLLPHWHPSRQTWGQDQGKSSDTEWPMARVIPTT